LAGLVDSPGFGFYYGNGRNLVRSEAPLLFTPKPSGHQKIEERSIALHKRISELLERDPQWLDVARQNLRKGVEVHGNLPVFHEWARILDYPIGQIRAILISPSEKARWLRQSSPFAGILEPQERWKIYEAFSA
jgi:hypothetical protein